jgi:hypothetical protein
MMSPLNAMRKRLKIASCPCVSDAKCERIGWCDAREECAHRCGHAAASALLLQRFVPPTLVPECLTPLSSLTPLSRRRLAAAAAASRRPQLYKAQRGNLLVPTEFVVPAAEEWPERLWSLPLGQRCSAIRSRNLYVQGHPQRAAQLVAIGFDCDNKNQVRPASDVVQGETH